MIGLSNSDFRTTELDDRSQPGSDLQSEDTSDTFWPVADPDDHKLTDHNRCIAVNKLDLPIAWG